MATHPMTAEMMQEAVEAMKAHGSQVKAAQAMNLSRAALQSRLIKAARKGLMGFAPVMEGFEVASVSTTQDKNGNIRSASIKQKPEVTGVFNMPPAHQLKGVSALLDSDGRLVQQWVKTREGAIGNGLVEALQEAFASFTGLAPVVQSEGPHDPDCLTLYAATDLHIGMLSYWRETGENFDLDIAKKLYTQKYDDLIGQSKPTKMAYIAFIGDLLHANDQRNVTPGHGHQLDVDGRYSKGLRITAEIALHIIQRASEKHEHVEVIVIPGNHDVESAKAIHLALRLFYRDNPNITVNDHPSDIIYMRFGKTLFGFCHGDKMKPQQMAHAMAADRPQDWGATTCRRFYSGHFHHEAVTFAGAVRCETFTTPAARDAHAHRSGYRAERALTAVSFHIERGEIGRHQVIIQGGANE